MIMKTKMLIVTAAMIPVAVALEIEELGALILLSLVLIFKIVRDVKA